MTALPSPLESITRALAEHRAALREPRFGGLFAGYVTACTCETVFKGCSEAEAAAELATHQFTAILAALEDDGWGIEPAQRDCGVPGRTAVES